MNATHPHIAGSIEDYTDATVILKLFQDHFGIIAPPEPPRFPAGSPASHSAMLNINKLHKPTAWINIYYPVMNTPLDRSIEILGPNGEVDAVPTFHGLSADGIAEGEIVYVNYGRKEDYDEIVAKGGNLTGKIVLAQYGAIPTSLSAPPNNLRRTPVLQEEEGNAQLKHGDFVGQGDFVGAVKGYIDQQMYISN